MEQPTVVKCPGCRMVVRATGVTCTACGEWISTDAAERAAATRTTSKTLAWGTPRPHRVAHVLVLVSGLAAIAVSAGTNQIVGVLPCVAVALYLVARRPKRSDGRGSLAYRLWLQPSAKQVLRDDANFMAGNRVLLTEPPSAQFTYLAVLGCGLWPVALLYVSSGSNLTRSIVAQGISWFAIAVAAWRMNRRDAECEAVEIETPRD